jgi:hypothetical protein
MLLIVLTSEVVVFVCSYCSILKDDFKFLNLPFAGKKTCLHIHGVFPYMYIPYEGSGAHDRLMYQIASSLDKALNISLGKTNSTVQHVFKMTLVSGL